MGGERSEAYRQLATPTAPIGTFSLDDITELPAAAQRFLSHALSPGVGLVPTVLLEMEGEIKLKRWMPFRARQVLRAGSGFVWGATVGKIPIRFSGGDSYWHGAGTLDFRLWGLFPVARETGPDINRSAAGRLAAETVAWAPQALTELMGASWVPIDADTATVTLPVGDDTFDVTVSVDSGGCLRELVMLRWGDPDPGALGEHPFGGSVDDYAEFGGVAIASAGRVGWWWGTDRQDEGEFFRYRITDAHLATTEPQ